MFNLSLQQFVQIAFQGLGFVIGFACTCVVWKYHVDFSKPVHCPQVGSVNTFFSDIDVPGLSFFLTTSTNTYTYTYTHMCGGMCTTTTVTIVTKTIDVPVCGAFSMKAE